MPHLHEAPAVVGVDAKALAKHTQLLDGPLNIVSGYGQCLVSGWPADSTTARLQRFKKANCSTNTTTAAQTRAGSAIKGRTLTPCRGFDRAAAST
jgi:hypothetical protein